MQLIRVELERARARRAEASDPRAIAALDGVILALEWAFEDGGRAGPSEVAAALVSEPIEDDPLDHDGDGKKGGSLPGKRATARKRKGK